jgi:HSP20 family protein
MRIVLNNTPAFGNIHTGPRGNGRCSPIAAPERRATADSFVNALLRDFAGVAPARNTTGEREARVGLRVVAHEKPEAWIFRADVPGVPADKLDISVENDVVTIRATRALGGPEGYRLIRGERRGTEATARFELPVDANAESLRATLRDGVLELSVGRRNTTARRSIAVEVRHSSNAAQAPATPESTANNAPE